MVLVRDLLEPLAEGVLTFLELFDVRLEVLTYALDAGEGPLAGERGLRSIALLRVQLLLVGLFDPLDGALGIEQDVVRDTDILIERCTLFPLEEVRERVRCAGVQRPHVDLDG